MNEWALPRVCRRDPGQRHPLWSPLKPPTSFQAYSCVLSSQQAPQQVLCLPSAIGKALHDNLKSPILISPSSLHSIEVQIYFAQQKNRPTPFVGVGLCIWKVQIYFVQQKKRSTPFVGVGLCIWKHLHPPPPSPFWKIPCVCNCRTTSSCCQIHYSLNLSLYIPFTFYIGLLMVDIILPNSPLSQHILIPRHALTFLSC